MKRCLLAMTLLLSGAVSFSYADYVIIRVVLRQPGGAGGAGGNQGFPGGNLGFMGGEDDSGEGPKPGGNIGFPGGMPGGNIGFMGQPGPGGPGPMPGGNIGFPGGQPGGNIGFPGGQLGNKGGGNIGFMGQPGPGGPGPIPGGNIGFPGGMPGGNIGFMGQPGPGGPGPIPGGNIGFPGGQPGGNIGFPGGQPGGMQGGTTSPQLDPSDYVTAVVELSGYRERVKLENVREPISVLLMHKWGKTALYMDGSEIQVKPVRMPTPLKRYEALKLAIDKSRDRSPDRYLDLAEYCLSIGLPDKCKELLAFVEKQLTDKKDKDAKSVPAKVTKALEAYNQIKPFLNSDIDSQEKAKLWKERLNYNNVVLSKHYALIHNSEDPAKEGVNRRLETLEQNLQSFYLWFALKGKALPAPSERLVAILVSDPAEFRKNQKAFEAKELVADSFYAKQDNLAIFSARRVDTASRNYEQLMRVLYKKFQPDELLAAKFPRTGTGPGAVRTDEVARAQMLALVERALQEESEIASATQEGTRQLIAATGLLPRSASAPEWLRFGLTSFFEMPKGPFPGKSSNVVKSAFWPGAGGPNWAWKRYIEELQQSGKLGDVPAEIMLDTITDLDFAKAHATGRQMEKLKQQPMEGEDPMGAYRDALDRARALSWGLTFFLMHEHFNDFMKYLDAIANLPRDAELDEYTHLTTFAQAFGIPADQLDPAKPRAKMNVQALANEWVRYLRTHRSLAVEMQLEDPPEPNPNPGGGGFPNPGGPGGFPGPGGPGGFPNPGGPGGFPGPGGPGGFPNPGGPGGFPGPGGPGNPR